MTKEQLLPTEIKLPTNQENEFLVLQSDPLTTEYLRVLTGEGTELAFFVTGRIKTSHLWANQNQPL